MDIPVTADEINEAYRNFSEKTQLFGEANALNKAAHDTMDATIFATMKELGKEYTDSNTFISYGYVYHPDLLDTLKSTERHQRRASIDYDKAKAEVNRIEALLKLSDAIAHWPNGGQDK